MPHSKPNGVLAVLLHYHTHHNQRWPMRLQCAMPLFKLKFRSVSVQFLPFPVPSLTLFKESVDYSEATNLSMELASFLRSRIFIVDVSTSITSTNGLDAKWLSSLFFTVQNVTGSSVFICFMFHWIAELTSFCCRFVCVLCSFLPIQTPHTQFASKLYDYILTIDDEITLIWFTPWSCMNLLFFLVRYTPFVAIYFVLGGMSFWTSVLWRLCLIPSSIVELFPNAPHYMCFRTNLLGPGKNWAVIASLLLVNN
jgi:hypothetical protein